MTSRTGALAVRVLVRLALLPPGSFAGATALAREIDAPRNYLGKLLLSMSREGWVESRKGVGGGFRLARDPAQITLLEVLEPIEQLSRWRGCFLGLAECSDDSPCGVHDRWGELRESYLSFLSDTTIGEIVERYRAKTATRPASGLAPGRSP